MSSVVPAFTLRYALGFLAFAYGWTWTFWTIAGLGDASIWSAPSIYLFVVGGLGVPLRGVTMTRIAYGPGALRDLGRRIVQPRRIRGRWWMLILLLFPVLTV